MMMVVTVMAVALHLVLKIMEGWGSVKLFLAVAKLPDELKERRMVPCEV